MSHSSENENPEMAAPGDGAPEQSDERVASLEAEVAKAKDDMLRALAEVQNVRRRSEKEAADARVFAIERFARDLLPIADTLSRALAAVPPEARSATDEATRTLIEGIELTERTLLETFSRHNLKQIGAKGDRFDPNLHQAVAQIPSDAPAQHVAEVLQPGFVLGDRTIRAAMVVVSLGQMSPPPSSDSGSVDIKV